MKTVDLRQVESVVKISRVERETEEKHLIWVSRARVVWVSRTKDVVCRNSRVEREQTRKSNIETFESRTAEAKSVSSPSLESTQNNLNLQISYLYE